MTEPAKCNAKENSEGEFVDEAAREALEDLIDETIEAFLAEGKAELDLSGQGIRDLPESLGQLKSLTYLDLSLNLLTSLPDTIGQLSSLKELNLYNNHSHLSPTQLGSFRP